jgi:hypothetical protein
MVATGSPMVATPLRRLLAWPGAYLRAKTDRAGTEALAGVFVWTVWATTVVLSLALVLKYGSRLFKADDWANLGLLCKGFGAMLPDLWALHCEHRIALPRLVSWLVLPLAGYDQRALMLLSVGLLATGAAVLLRAVAAVRGRADWTDAALPLLLAGLGHYENFLWGFQIQFTLSTCLCCIVLAALLRHGSKPRSATLLTVGLAGMLLPLCGANGLAFAVPVVLWLGFVSLQRRSWLAGLAMLAVGSVVVAYLWGYRKPDFHPTTRDPVALARTGLQFLANGLGGGALDPHALTATGWPLLGVVVLGLFALGLTCAAVAVWQMPRGRSVGLALLGGGCLLLTAGVTYGRAALPDGGTPARYASIAVLVPVWVYVVVGVGLPKPLARLMQVGLCLLVVFVLWPNCTRAIEFGRHNRVTLQIAEAAIRSVPLKFVPDRVANTLWIWDQQYFHAAVETMAARRWGVFRHTPPTPALKESRVTLTLVQAGECVPGDGVLAFTSPDGNHCWAIWQLDRPRRVRGLRLRYTLATDTPTHKGTSISWSSDPFGGGLQPTDQQVLFNQLPSGEREVLVWIDSPLEYLRVQFHLGACQFTLHEAFVLE